jgi:hypothetical protein
MARMNLQISDAAVDEISKARIKQLEADNRRLFKKVNALTRERDMLNHRLERALINPNAAEISNAASHLVDLLAKYNLVYLDSGL